MWKPDIPSIPALGVGSYAAPGWYIAMHRKKRAGELGTHDAEELLEDATRIVVDDQKSAGVDIFTDGELSRQRFVYEVFERLTGLERIEPARRLGIPGYDMAPSFRVRDDIEAPGGLGILEEFKRLKKLVPHKAKKIALPGPFTFAGSINTKDTQKERVIDSLVRVLRNEIALLVEEGADYIQLDEPGITRLEPSQIKSEVLEVTNRLFEGFAVRSCLHVCFGNNAGRPMANRRLNRLIEYLLPLKCNELMLEFANRGLVDVELTKELSTRFDIAAGVIDVKNFWLEPPEEVARRLEICLKFIPENRLSATADCGFSALPRYLAFQKLKNLVEGTHLVRGTL